MKRIVLYVTFCLLTAVFAEAQNNVSIGAWNIQWLGNADQRSGCGKDVNQTAEDIALYISESRVDILALEEIGDTDGSSQARTNRTLDRVMEILNRSDDNDWKYLLFAKRSINATTQMTGIMWNDDKIDKVGDPYRIEFDLPSGGTNFWDRWATAVKFKFGNNKTDIVIIPVHMKANVGSGNHVLQREREAGFLADELTSTICCQQLPQVCGRRKIYSKIYKMS